MRGLARKLRAGCGGVPGALLRRSPETDQRSMSAAGTAVSASGAPRPLRPRKEQRRPSAAPGAKSIVRSFDLY